MAKVQLKSLSIINFKGIKEMFINFRHHITNIYGDNATGKTTVFDAFLWLFFGKNSDDITQFEVKPLDENNKFIKDLESEVNAIVQIDDQEISIKKVLRQKWVKRRGELTANYEGDENVYYWNDVPCKESEFKTKVKAIIDEMVFKLITNPFYFNSLKWQERRDILIELAGNVSNSDVLDNLVTAANKSQYIGLINALNQNKTLDEYKREIGAKKKRIKEEAESIPSRIDEVRRGMPKAADFEAIRTELEEAKEEAVTIQNALADEVALQTEENKRRSDLLKAHNKQIQDHQQKIFGIKTQLQNIEFEAKQSARESTSQVDSNINGVKRHLSDKQAELTNYRNKLNALRAEVAENDATVESLRESYEKKNDEVFAGIDENDFTCPTCKQHLPLNDIETKKEEMLSNFNEKKQKSLTQIIADANRIKKENEGINVRISNGESIIAQLEHEISHLETRLEILNNEAKAPSQSVEDIISGILSNNDQYTSLKKELTVLEAKKFTEPVFDALVTNTELKAQLQGVNSRIQQLQQQLSDESQITKANARITELEQQESTLAQELATLEGTEHAILQFTKAKIDAVERRINSKFSFVKFKMFSIQKNGAEIEDCTTLVNSNGSYVPFADANNAAKINAGIDIINALCKHYQVTAPIYIDNRESVTKLIDTDSQIVNLIVSEPDKMLRVA